MLLLLQMDVSVCLLSIFNAFLLCNKGETFQ